MQKKVYEELQAESLWIEEEIAKAQAGVNISEGENIDSTLENTNNGRHESRVGQGSIDFQQPTISKGSNRKSNTICKTNKVVLQQIKLKVTWLIDKSNLWRSKELAQSFIHNEPRCGSANAMRCLEQQVGNPHKLLASYRREIKQMTKIKPGDAAAYRRLLNLLIKYQSLEYGNQNPPDTPGVICLILKKIPGYLQDRR